MIRLRTCFLPDRPSHGLIVAANQLNDILQRWNSQIVDEICTDAEAKPDPSVECVVQTDHFREVEHVRENQCLCFRIAAVLPIMLDEMFAPFEGITGVMAGAVKEFAEVHIEVQQEGFHAVHVGERNSQGHRESSLAHISKAYF